jgi:serine/threonine protein kinase
MQKALGEDGRYRPVRQIAAGGMGEIWEADDTLLGRRVAVKVLAEELTSDRAAVRRFGQEARATAKLAHPNVTRVYDFTDGAAPMLVLELLEGQTLADRLRHRDPLPPLERQGLPRPWLTARTPRIALGSFTATSSPATSCSRLAAT